MDDIEILKNYLHRLRKQVKNVLIDTKPTRRKKIITYEDLQNEYVFNLLCYARDILWFSEISLRDVLVKNNYHNLIPNIRILLEVYIQILFIVNEDKKKVAQFFIDNKKLIFLINYVRKTRVKDYTPQKMEIDIQKVYKNIIEEYDLTTNNTLEIQNIEKYKSFGTSLFSYSKTVNKFIKDSDKRDWINASYSEFSEYEHARPTARLYFPNLRKRTYYAFLASYSLWILEELVKSKRIGLSEARKQSYNELYSQTVKDRLLIKLKSVSILNP